MNSAERRLLEGVVRRAQALSRYAQGELDRDHHMPVVFTFIASNLVRTIFGLCAVGLRDNIIEWMVTSVREGNGVCMCGQHAKALSTDALCPQCIEECEAADRESEIYEHMERPVKGPTS